MSTFDLFVYGTLHTGQSANSILSDCTTQGVATLNGIMYNIDDRFPAVILYGETPIHGELWRCPAALLLDLDEYEGVPAGLFRRVGAEARMQDGGTAACWVYVAGPKLSRRLVPENRIDSGRYQRP